MNFLLGDQRTADDLEEMAGGDEAARVAVCCPEGDLDTCTVSAFREGAAALCGWPWVIFDLSRLTFMDSVGLGALIGAIRRVREAGGQAIVCAPRRPVGRLLRTVGLDRIAPVEDSLEVTLRRIHTAS